MKYNCSFSFLTEMLKEATGINNDFLSSRGEIRVPFSIMEFFFSVTIY